MTGVGPVADVETIRRVNGRFRQSQKTASDPEPTLIP
jgi:hypothetical protein